MGPWLCSHGNPSVGVWYAINQKASMGPWLCSHGNAEVDDGAANCPVGFNGAVAV